MAKQLVRMANAADEVLMRICALCTPDLLCAVVDQGRMSWVPPQGSGA